MDYHVPESHLTCAHCHWIDIVCGQWLCIHDDVRKFVYDLRGRYQTCDHFKLERRKWKKKYVAVKRPK